VPARTVLTYIRRTFTAAPASAIAPPLSAKLVPTNERIAVPTAESRTLFVKRESGTDFAALEAKPDLLVGLLKEAIREKLGLAAPLDMLTLHVAKGKAGTDLEGALDSTDTIEEALPQHGESKPTRIVVRMAGAVFAAPPVAVLDASGTLRLAPMSKPGTPLCRAMTAARSLHIRSSTF
jgi:hypothetical protein